MGGVRHRRSRALVANGPARRRTHQSVHRPARRALLGIVSDLLGGLAARRPTAGRGWSRLAPRLCVIRVRARCRPARPWPAVLARCDILRITTPGAATRRRGTPPSGGARASASPGWIITWKCSICVPCGANEHSPTSAMPHNLTRSRSRRAARHHRRYPARRRLSPIRAADDDHDQAAGERRPDLSVVCCNGGSRTAILLARLRARAARRGIATSGAFRTLFGRCPRPSRDRSPARLRCVRGSRRRRRPLRDRRRRSMSWLMGSALAANGQEGRYDRFTFG